MNDNLKKLECKMNSLTVFRNLLKNEVVSKMLKLMGNQPSEMTEKVYNYSDFVSSLYRKTDNLSEYILKIVLEDENFYILNKSQGKEFSTFIEDTVENELRILQEFSRISSDELKNSIGYDEFLPSWNTLEIDFVKEYTERVNDIERYGYGVYAKYYMFIVKENNIVPVKYPDEIQLSQLIGYEKQRQLIIDNTKALINGKPASNVLLTGDAGTGKSSSVKAIANEFRDKGLRIIEIRKDQLRDIPLIIDNLSKNPLKFILFVDDLSFASDDDNFSALKAILEGSVSARADNIVIYATSNRRHLVKEKFSDRDGDDMHRNDTVQEMISLSERFGLKISFSKPNKAEYLEIVYGLARQSGLDMAEEELEKEAERFAIGRSGRSARAAKQLIDKMLTCHDVLK